MQIVREDLNPCTVKLTVTCDPSEVELGFKKAYKAASKSIRIPGFRPGQAPKSMIDAQVNPDALRETAAEEIVKSTWRKAVEQEGLEPYLQPYVEIAKIEQAENACEFWMKVPLKPVVELGDYKALTAKRPKIDVDDKEVENQIDEMRKRRGSREAVTDRGAEEGDSAVVNIKLDGDGGEHTFMTVIGKNFKELDKVLTGMKAEEMRSADLKFPKDFQEKDWAGKKAHAQVTLRSLASLKLPELDDDFAQKLDAANIGELKTRIKEAILRMKLDNSSAFVNEQIMDDLVAKSKIEVPDNLWETVANQRLRDLQQEQGQRGKSLQQYAEEQNMKIEEFVEAISAEAKMFVVRAQAIQEIFVSENMKITTNDLNDELMLFAQEYGMQPKDALELLRANDSLQELQHRSVNRKVMTFLNGHAKIEETEEAA